MNEKIIINVVLLKKNKKNIKNNSIQKKMFSEEILSKLILENFGNVNVSLCILNSNFNLENNIDFYLLNLLDKLEKYKEKLFSLKKDFDLYLSIIIHSKRAPQLYFDNIQILKISNFKFNFEINVLPPN